MIVKTKSRAKGWNKKPGRGVAFLLFSLLLALLLAACGEDRTLTLPTAQPESAIVPFRTALPSVTPSPAPTATPEPTATATPEPTTTPAPTATDTPAPTNTAPPRATATPRPTVNLTPAPIKGADELKVIKAGYDAINDNYFTQPDTAAMAQKALEEAAAALGLPAPGPQTWEDAKGNWRLLEERLNAMLPKSKALLPSGDFAHRVVVAMANAVGDLHTYFLDVERSDSVNRMGRGDNSTVGFGVSYVQYQGSLYVQRLITDGPAEAAGVKVGDRLVQLDGTDVTTTNLSRVLRVAKEGNSYRFVLERPGQSQPVTLDIEYKRYKILTAEWKIIDNHIGFITLNAFHLDVQTKLDEAIDAVKKQGADSLIIDLRFNGGGYNFERVAGRFVKDGEVLGKFINRKSAGPLKARSDGKFVEPALPLVVLIDRGSASASEVFSLAVRDYNVGTLIGNNSAGAIGTVRYWPLGDGTLLGVTASVYETVKGEKLNGVGVTPDIVVQRSTPDILAGRDPQLDAAIKNLSEKLKAKP